MRVTMDAVWNRTTRVLAARGGTVAAVAATLLFVPAVLRLVVQSPPGAAPGRMFLGAAVGLLTVLLSLWGQLSLTALTVGDDAVDAATSRTGRTALRAGLRRMPAAIAVGLAALAVVVLAFAPVGVAMVRAGIDPSSMATGTATTLPANTARFIGIFALVFVVVALGLASRLCILYPVVLCERRGLGAYPRAFRLTRGHGWRLFGILLLYIVVLLVVTGAVRFVVGTAAALALGPGTAAAALVALIAVAAVNAVLSAVAVVFLAQAYRLLRERTDGVAIA